MGRVTTPTQSWVHRKACPSCGFAGTELQCEADEAVYECPRCGEDLYARAAMSYAEREGLVVNGAWVGGVSGGEEMEGGRKPMKWLVAAWVRGLMRRVLGTAGSE